MTEGCLIWTQSLLNAYSIAATPTNPPSTPSAKPASTFPAAPVYVAGAALAVADIVGIPDAVGVELDAPSAAQFVKV